MNGHLPEPRPHLDVVLRSFRPHRSDYAARTYTVETVDTAGRRRCVGVVFRDVDAWGRPGPWLVRGTGGQVLVSPADGVGPGGCPTRDEALTVLEWKLNGSGPGRFAQVIDIPGGVG